jgi:tRNA-specific adenosine deaminase 1
MDVSGDEIAEVVLKEFDKWPTKRKPLLRGDGVKEWVPLSGIVAQGETFKSGGLIIGLII